MCHINAVIKLPGKFVGFCFDNQTFSLNRLSCTWQDERSANWNTNYRNVMLKDANWFVYVRIEVRMNRL
jgi:hypothetical protein